MLTWLLHTPHAPSQRSVSWGLLLLRLFVSLRVLYGVVDNIVSPDRMLEFAYFLKLHAVPYPFVSAVVSVYVQAVAALLVLAGCYSRIGCLLLMSVFAVATWLHRSDSVEQATPALAIWFVSAALLLMGPGQFVLPLRSRRFLQG